MYPPRQDKYSIGILLLCQWTSIFQYFARNYNLFLFFLLQLAEPNTTRICNNATTPHVSAKYHPILDNLAITWPRFAVPFIPPSRPSFASQSQGTLSSATIPPSSASRRTRWCVEEGLNTTTTVQLPVIATTPTALQPGTPQIKRLKWWSSGHENTGAMIANSSISITGEFLASPPAYCHHPQNLATRTLTPDPAGASTQPTTVVAGRYLLYFGLRAALSEPTASRTAQ
ncbi:hypothetical protein B0T09DRAFT_136687 [Sordaria sp. MPI-SDFR-AT-0083]|nr:hypothetical protein B0T09DRAFT_136687 [Sordaria sp. MPI-SDFR-AT-0083]